MLSFKCIMLICAWAPADILVLFFWHRNNPLHHIKKRSVAYDKCLWSGSRRWTARFQTCLSPCLLLVQKHLMRSHFGRYLMCHADKTSLLVNILCRVGPKIDFSVNFHSCNFSKLTLVKIFKLSSSVGLRAKPNAEVRLG